MKRTKSYVLRFNWGVLLGLLLVGICYFLTMLPGLGFHDVGELQGVVPILQIAHPTGFPSYMLTSYFLSLFLFGQEEAWRINFLSLLYTLGSLFLLYRINSHITGKKLLSFAAVAFVGFTLPLWNYAGMADTHVFGRFMLASVLYAVLLLKQRFSRVRLDLFCLLAGFALGGHLFILYALPFVFGFTLYILKGHLRAIIGSRLLLEASAYFLLGLSSYLFLPIRSLVGIQLLDYSLATWDGFFRHVSGSDFQGLMFTGSLSTIIHNIFLGLLNLLKWLGIGGTSFAILGIVFGVIKYKQETLLMLLICISFVTFAANYPTSDDSRYYGWILLFSSYFITLGAVFVSRIVAFRTFYYFIFVILFFMVGYSVYKNFHQVDKHKNVSAQVYSVQIMSLAEPNAVILTWWHYMTPLRYTQMVKGSRPDILLVTKGPGDWLAEADFYRGIRPVYVVQPEASLEERYNLISVGPFYKLVPVDK